MTARNFEFHSDGFSADNVIGIIPFTNVQSIVNMENIFTITFINKSKKRVTLDVKVKKTEIETMTNKITSLIPNIQVSSRKFTFFEASGSWSWLFVMITVVCSLLLYVVDPDSQAYELFSKTNMIIVLGTTALICLIGTQLSYMKNKQVFAYRNPNMQI